MKTKITIEVETGTNEHYSLLGVLDHNKIVYTSTPVAPPASPKEEQTAEEKGVPHMKNIPRTPIKKRAPSISIPEITESLENISQKSINRIDKHFEELKSQREEQTAEEILKQHVKTYLFEGGEIYNAILAAMEAYKNQSITHK